MFGIWFVTTGATLRAGLGRNLACGASHLGSDDAGRDSEDAVAEDHDQRRQNLSQIGLGGDITITDRGHGDDCPVDATRDAGKAVFRPFDEIHGRANNHLNCDDRKQKNHDLAGARLQGTPERLDFSDVGRQLQNTENPQDTQEPDDEQETAAREEQADIGRDSAE